VLVVSHDREFLNNVATSTIVFEDGNVREYVGGYDDWQRQRAAQVAETPIEKPATRPQPAKPAATSGPRKLTYKERLELESLPERISQLESHIDALHTEMAQPQFYQQPGPQIAEAQARLKQLETDLSAAYARWEELERVAT
jgi:ABC transport system ATP-binding/permease protein